MIYPLIKPIIFKIDPEQAHDLAISALKNFDKLLTQKPLETDPVEIMGLKFPNPVGIAAGFDKNAECINGLGKLGFGFIEVGTVTPVAQMGNAKPRLFRLPNQNAIINRMGFNNQGVENLVKNIKKSNYSGVLGINIGKNKDTSNDNALSDYLFALNAVYEYSDYVTINISSPNTAGLRDLQTGKYINSLLEAIKEEQLKLSQEFGYKPIAVKIAPDLDDEDVVDFAKKVNSFEIDCVIATNTTIDKSSISGHKHADEQGGLSGKPLTKRSNQVIKLLADTLNENVPIIGVGGIMTAQDAVDKINAGASLIQIYTGFIYGGPPLIADSINAIKRNRNNK